MIPVSLSSFIYLNYPLDEALRRIAQAGFNGVDIWGGRPHAYRKDLNQTEISEIKQLIGQLDLGVASFIPAQFRYPTSLCSQNEVIRQDSVAYIKDSIQTASGMGAPLVSVCPGHSLFGQSTTAAWDCLRRSLDEICLFAASRSMRIAIEPADKYETDLINTIPDALRIIDQLGHDNLGVVLDCGHSYVVGESAAEVAGLAQDRLFHVHVDDNNGLRDQHLIPGLGTFNFVPFLEALEKRNYQGYLCVELSWDVTVDPDPAAFQALEYFRKSFN
jgi:fructoselysine 3-epimerase